jgi:hypothetical protein
MKRHRGGLQLGMTPRANFRAALGKLGGTRLITTTQPRTTWAEAPNPLTSWWGRSTPSKGLSVSNSLSGRHWDLDKVPAVGDPAHIVQFARATVCPPAKVNGVWPSTTHGYVSRCRRPESRRASVQVEFTLFCERVWRASIRLGSQRLKGARRPLRAAHLSEAQSKSSRRTQSVNNLAPNTMEHRASAGG